MSEQVNVGDTICFSAALLQQIHNEPEHRSILVEVIEVRTDPNGAKTLVLQRREDRQAVDNILLVSERE